MEQTILAVESSCDDTAISVVSVLKDHSGHITAVKVRAHELASQIEIHAPFGGVVPEIAARDHLAKIYDLAYLALKKSNIEVLNLHAIAVTTGPGLIGALMVGVLFARGFATALNKPLISVNHVDAHLAPALLLKDFSPQQHINTWLQTTSIVYPALSLTVSGGHSHFSILSSKDKKELLGQSLDDACGEAFDKVSRLLGMGYPGGPFIEELAAQAEEHGLTEKYSFCQKFPDQKNRYNLSYSGLKTAVMEAIRKETGAMKGKITGKNLRLEQKQALAHSFQDAAILQLFNKTIYAIKDFPHIQSIIVAGGVAQNKKLRKMFLSIEKTVLFAPPSLCSDNATMIALQAFLDDKKNGFTEQAFSRYF